MLQFNADDGRILTPPKELEPQLKGAFPAFTRFIGHTRFFYVADEIWDGKSSLVFGADGEQVAAITLGDGVFYVHIEDKDFRIVDETVLDAVFETLKRTVPSSRCRPFEQLTVNMNDLKCYPCGTRCDMCLGNKKHNENDFAGSEKFDYMNWVCYHNCVPNVSIDRNVHNKSVCPGCESKKKDCPFFKCPTEKGHAHCVECGDYHACDTRRDCHYPGQCNLGITAEEVTNLVIPYCMKERLDVWRDATYTHTIKA